MLPALAARSIFMFLLKNKGKAALVTSAAAVTADHHINDGEGRKKVSQSVFNKVKDSVFEGLGLDPDSDFAKFVEEHGWKIIGGVGVVAGLMMVPESFRGLAIAGVLTLGIIMLAKNFLLDKVKNDQKIASREGQPDQDVTNTADQTASNAKSDQYNLDT